MPVSSLVETGYTTDGPAKENVPYVYTYEQVGPAQTCRFGPNSKQPPKHRRFLTISCPASHFFFPGGACAGRWAFHGVHGMPRLRAPSHRHRANRHRANRSRANQSAPRLLKTKTAVLTAPAPMLACSDGKSGYPPTIWVAHTPARSQKNAPVVRPLSPPLAPSPGLSSPQTPFSSGKESNGIYTKMPLRWAWRRLHGANDAGSDLTCSRREMLKNVRGQGAELLLCACLFSGCCSGRTYYTIVIIITTYAV